MEGLKRGQPRIKLSRKFIKVKQLYVEGEISRKDACRILNIPPTTFINYLTVPETEIDYLNEDGLILDLFEIRCDDKSRIVDYYDLLDELDITDEILKDYFNGKDTAIGERIEIIRK